jgi:hypothetical protein
LTLKAMTPALSLPGLTMLSAHTLSATAFMACERDGSPRERGGLNQ